ncbi:Hsp70 family protein [Synechococcus sp. RSCCF101]|uniref:Hsp70 family protein n=1 Tax=Synechococcus sp. RSCCF101 TaxID=2511069 RepID=UPI0012444565|nr:Hsp70 family protein [Synechococcus sp. RSCCF101]QEY33148.1 Hsp70 family protein [Synechococcus sp. RSCCF101]
MHGTLAIDLGSTTTVVAFQASGSPTCELVAIPELSLGDPAVIPSLVWSRGGAAMEARADGTIPDGAVLVGRQVLEAGLDVAPATELKRDFKRWIGAPPGVERPVEASLPAFSAETAGSLLIQRLWARLPGELVPDRLVLTAPVDGYRAYRSWLMEAVASLDIPEVALVDEPTAAAIGAGVPAGSRLLVVDLGGGTIDMALVALEGGEGRAAPLAQLLRFAGRDLPQRDSGGQTLRCARVIAKAGLRLGGRDVDRWIARHLCPDRPASAALLRAAERLKCRLSDAEVNGREDPAEEVELTGDGDPDTARLRLTRSELDDLLQRNGLEGALDRMLEEVLTGARAGSVAEEQIDAVLPVGGSARLPLVRRWLQERCGRWRCLDRHPIEAVSRGALSLTPNVAIQDVLHRGVSLRTWDRRQSVHRWHPLFLAGQTTPTTTPLELVLGCQHPDQPAIELVLGEPTLRSQREVVMVDGLPVVMPVGQDDDPERETARPWPGDPLTLPLSPPGQPGSDRVLLRWSITGRGALTLSWRDLLTEAEMGEIVLGTLR